MVDPIYVDDSSSSGDGLERMGGSDMVEDGTDALVKGMIANFVDRILGEVIDGMAVEVACDVGFEEDAPDIWELRRC